MPKYRNKQRLKEILASGKEVNSLTRYLILEDGLSYEEAIKGLEPAVSEWEMRVKYIEEAKTTDIGYSEEYDYDLWSRSELYREMQHAPDEELRKFSDRIDQADQRFKNATVEYSLPNNHVDNPDKEIHWWLFRVNKE